jgi:hypothetical protein
MPVESKPPSTAIVAHQRRRGLGAQERPGQVDRQHARPVFVSHVEDRLEDGDAGIVDQRIEAAESLDEVVESKLHARGVRYVAFNCHRDVRLGQGGAVRLRLSPSMSSSATR